MGRTRKCELGKTYGRLFVAEELDYRIRQGISYRCECECGNNNYLVQGGDLRSGKVHSCGCLKSEIRIKENTTHGMKGSRLYGIYYAMISRVNNPNASHYERYGGRGITITQEWIGDNGFVNFMNWSNDNGYSDELTIDRINNDGNYEPSNCRWVTNEVQANNKSTNRLYTLNGETLNISQWSKKYNVNYDNLINRLNRGSSIEKALFELGVDL